MEEVGESDLLTEEEAARYLRMEPSHLGNRRRAGQGPPSVKLFGRNGPALYPRDALLAWVKARLERFDAPPAGGA